MDYTQYKASRNLAWDILLHEGVREMPIKVSDICAGLGIALKSYKATDSNLGFCNIIDGRPYIFINSGASRDLKRITAAHELGHIMLGHVGEFMNLKSSVPSGFGDYERAADAFALRLLAPACVLWGCGIKSTREIVHFCEIPYESAVQRMQRMKVLYKRNVFLHSDVEKAVFEQFSPFIRRFRREAEKL